jgi:sugar/nucleoside kinase (ribokinase family)
MYPVPSKPLDVVCLGILVVDLFARPVERLPAKGTLELVDEIGMRGGGSALNTATALVRLGLRAGAAGKVGADTFGEFLLGLVNERGIDGRCVLVDRTVPTSASVVLLDSEGERTFLHLPGANGHLRSEELDRELLFSGRALHLAGALVLDHLDGEPAAEILAEAKRRGLQTSLDTIFASGRWERVLPSLPYTDVFTPGLREAQAITGEEDPVRAASWLRNRGVGEVIVTLGPEGCYASGADFEGTVAPLDVEVVDGTGAGDAFAAGLIYGKLAGWPVERRVQLANAVGALATTAVGASEGVRGLEETLALAGLA